LTFSPFAFEESRIRAPEGVPADPARDSSCLHSRLQVPTVKRFWPVGLRSFDVETGKVPILRLRGSTKGSPESQCFRQTRIQRNRLARCLRLALAHVLKRNGPRDADLELLEINVLPFECQQFTHPQPCHHIDQSHRLGSFAKERVRSGLARRWIFELQDQGWSPDSRIRRRRADRC